MSEMEISHYSDIPSDLFPGNIQILFKDQTKGSFSMSQHNSPDSKSGKNHKISTFLKMPIFWQSVWQTVIALILVFLFTHYLDAVKSELTTKIDNTQNVLHAEIQNIENSIKDVKSNLSDFKSEANNTHRFLLQLHVKEGRDGHSPQHQAVLAPFLPRLDTLAQSLPAKSNLAEIYSAILRHLDFTEVNKRIAKHHIRLENFLSLAAHYVQQRHSPAPTREPAQASK
ncbi:MAG: hypothetical protein D6814_14645 [Calditrichaeota bacterium]|nr:MAG: hypothetical protein D6814_14645 [Calditrichota bacterium]